LKKTPILLGLLDMLSVDYPNGDLPALAALFSDNPTTFLLAGDGFDGSPAEHIPDMGMSLLLAARSIDMPALKEIFPSGRHGVAEADCGDGLSRLCQTLYSGITCGEFDFIVFAVFGEPDAAEFNSFLTRLRNTAASQGCIALFSSRFPSAKKDARGMLPLIVTGADIKLKSGKASGLFPTIFDLMGLLPPSGNGGFSLIAK